MSVTPLPPTPPLYRLHVRPACVDRAGSFEFCLEGGFLGVGWPTTDEPLDWPTYERLAAAKYGAVDGSVRAVHNLPDDALIWARDMTRGVYYLARVAGPWRYLHGEDATQYGIHNVRPVQMVPTGVESRVPGSVRSAFIPRRALQRVNDATGARYSAAVFGKLTGHPLAWHPTLDEVLTSCLDDEDLEDLVHMYLQCRFGYRSMRGTRRTSTPAYEYVMRHPDGHEAVVQVKRGRSTVPRDAGSLPTTEVERVYVFSPTGSYGPDPAANVVELDYDDLIEFMGNDRWSLPPRVGVWVSQALDDVPVRASS